MYNMVDEVSLHSLLALEKALFDNKENDLMGALVHSHSQTCSDEVMQFYWNITASIEQLLLRDITESKFRLRHAVINNNLLFVAIYLRKKQGDVNIIGEGEQTPIHWSTTSAMVDLLLSYGANLHHLAESGRTALHNCTTVEACEALLLAGLSPHILNKNRGSPLHNGFISSGITRMLLKHGADPNTLNYYEHSPLHVVASRGTWEVVYYLLCGGCDCSLVGRDGMSALSLARMVQSDVLRGGNPDKISVPDQEFVRLDKTIEMLMRWQENIQEGKSFAQTKYAVSKHFSWKAQALLCKDPLSGYREAMHNKVPEDVINEIIVHFVGPEGSRVNSYGKFNKMASFRRKSTEYDAFPWSLSSTLKQYLSCLGGSNSHSSPWLLAFIATVVVGLIGVSLAHVLIGV